MIPTWPVASALAQQLAAGMPAGPAWANYGIGGMAVGALVTGGIVVWRREASRGDRLEAEVRRLNEAIIDRYVPALESTTQATERALQAMQLLMDRIRSGP